MRRGPVITSAALGAVAVIAVTIAVIVGNGDSARARVPAASTSTLAPLKLEPLDGRAPDITEGQPTRGPVDAPVVIVAFVDYTCGHCAQFHIETEPRVLAANRDTVRLVVRHYPSRESFSPSHRAAQAAECAHVQGRFWEYNDDLFTKPGDFSQDDLVARGRRLHLDVDELRACIESEAMLDEVNRDIGEAEGASVAGTPGFLINGRLTVGAATVEHMQSEIDAALADM